VDDVDLVDPAVLAAAQERVDEALGDLRASS
jgi:hypothetical protein